MTTKKMTAEDDLAISAGLCPLGQDAATGNQAKRLLARRETNA
jgi:hypothetical protein